MDRARRRHDAEVEMLLGAADDSELVDSGGNRLSDCEDNTKDNAEESDSDWEDLGDQNVKENQRNLIPLRRFSRECDTYKQSNRGGAKLANALLKDFGYVTKADKSLLICPSKLRRERERWGQEREEKSWG